MKRRAELNNEPNSGKEDRVRGVRVGWIIRSVRAVASGFSWIFIAISFAAMVLALRVSIAPMSVIVAVRYLSFGSIVADDISVYWPSINKNIELRAYNIIIKESFSSRYAVINFSPSALLSSWSRIQSAEFYDSVIKVDFDKRAGAHGNAIFTDIAEFIKKIVNVEAIIARKTTLNVSLAGRNFCINDIDIKAFPDRDFCEITDFETGKKMADIDFFISHNEGITQAVNYFAAIREARIGFSSSGFVLAGQIRGRAAFPSGKFVIDGELAQINNTDNAYKTKITKQAPYVIGAIGEKIFIAESKIQFHVDDNLILIPKISCSIDGEKAFGAVSSNRCGQKWLSDISLKFESHVAIKKLQNIWPKNLAVGARDWITKNFHGGEINSVSCNIRVEHTENKNDVIEVRGNLDIKNVGVSFLDEMPQVKSVCAKSIFTEKKFDIDVLSGSFCGQSLGKSKIIICCLDQDVPDIDLDLHITGGFRNIIEVITKPPLGFLKKSPIDIASIRGFAATNLRFHFPLLKDLKKKDVIVSASSEVNDCGMSVLFSGKSFALTDGAMKISVSNKEMELDARGFLNGACAQAKWRQDFEKSGSGTLRLRYGPISCAQISDLVGIDVSPYTKGGIIITSEICPEKAKPYASINMDLTDQCVQIPEIQVKKSESQPLVCEISIKMDKSGVISSAHLETSGSISMLCDALFSEGQSIKEFSCYIQKPTVKVINYSSNALSEKVVIKADTIDARGFFGEEPSSEEKAPGKREKRANKNAEDSERSKSKSKKIVTSLGKNVIAEVRCGELILDNSVIHKVSGVIKGNRIIGSTKSSGFLSNLFLRSGKISGFVKEKGKILSDSGRVSVNIIPNGSDETKVVVEGKNAGSILNGFGISSRLCGGNIKINALQRRDGTCSGKMVIKGVYVRTPLLTKLVAIASPTGALELLSRDFFFRRISCEFSYDPFQAALFVKKFVCYGINMGISAKGKIDLDKGRFNMTGALIPAYMFNRMFSYIPFIGKLLGGEDGVLSTSFSIVGPTGSPAVEVNPLKTITPNFVMYFFPDLYLDRNEEISDER
ncbi:AsmA-like C-terminal domain-containing protein [Candidatus Hydrogenosomobacter endosymbioticus]|uniref:AsmA-like C-terminal domain-containing protein n=1 Tax=Candidatus Hydrogenosomobacter endosymbioticus TaxID=2558174 RepID=A0ABN6L2Q0_9PROT|nr:AsmA-like C-terminal domain-containing protein [Candidatus Hydrogenosomobacter endosymbioticus]BDB96134.1 hypothetical protein HYD_2670 [Candidatus Hydrogenosomobacter endosymbioticus]